MPQSEYHKRIYGDVNAPSPAQEAATTIIWEGEGQGAAGAQGGSNESYFGDLGTTSTTSPSGGSGGSGTPETPGEPTPRKGLLDGISQGTLGAFGEALVNIGERDFKGASKALSNELIRRQGLENAKKDSAGIYNRPFSIRYRDQETGREEVRAARLNNGQYEIQDVDGLWKPVHEVIGTNDYQVTSRAQQPDVEEGAGGIPNANTYSRTTKIPSFTFKRDGEQKVYGYALRAIVADRNLYAIENEIPTQQLADIYTGIGNWARQNSNQSLTAAVINKIVGDAGLQRYGREMSKYLQAILRTDTGAAYTGTEIADYLSAFGISPGQPVDGRTLADFRNGRAVELATLASRAGAASPYLVGLLDGTYELPEFDNISRGVSSYGTVDAGENRSNSGTTNSGVRWTVEE